MTEMGGLPRYEITRGKRIVNALMGLAVRLGIGPGQSRLLTTVGRKSGQRRTIPVSLVEQGGERCLVSPYGVRPWVLNVRASGNAELRRGRRRERVTLEELDAAASASVLTSYLTANSITAPYFDATPEADLAAFEAEADRHPTFRITASEAV